MITEEWRIDKNWYVNTPRNYFHINKIEFMIKKDETNIILGFHANNIDLDIKSNEERDGIWEWLKEGIASFHKAIQEHEKLHHEMAALQLEIQNRMAGVVCK